MDDVLLSSAGGWRHISNRIDQSAAKYLDQRAGAAFNFALFSAMCSAALAECYLL